MHLTKTQSQQGRKRFIVTQRPEKMLTSDSSGPHRSEAQFLMSRM